MNLKRASYLALLMCLWLSGGGCVGPVPGLYPPPAGQAAETIYVLHRGWHTGVILRAADIPPGLWPEHQTFPQAKYLEVGWGDTEGYRFPLTSGIAMRAMFASKGSVVLIHAFSGSITNEYAGIAKEIIAVRLSQPGFARLCQYIQDTYALDPQGRPRPLPAIYPHEHFFVATGHYSCVNNCNNWTAGALRHAGCPVCPRCCVLPSIVMRETRHFGQILWRHGRPVAPPKTTDRDRSRLGYQAALRMFPRLAAPAALPARHGHENAPASLPVLP